MGADEGVIPALAAHLRAGARRPFVWGACDCSLFAADWVMARRGVDPAAGLRGGYRTAIGAARHIRRLGGAEALGRRMAEAAGLAATTAPIAGDVGLVRHPRAGETFAILCPFGWAMKAPAGVAVITAAELPVLVAWSV